MKTESTWLTVRLILGTSFVARKLASTLGLEIAVDDPTRGLVAFLRGKRMLIILDCCERVVEAAAVLVENLLKGASGVGILATSREPLRAEGESVYRLPPLEVPPASIGLIAEDALAYPAVQLFRRTCRVERRPIRTQRCRCAGRRRHSAANSTGSASGDRTGGWARRRIRIVGRCRRDWRTAFSLLTRGRRTAIARHQTLAATLDWSYEALSEPEQAVLRRLSVFAGVFALDAAPASSDG